MADVVSMPAMIEAAFKVLPPDAQMGVGEMERVLNAALRALSQAGAGGGVEAVADILKQRDEALFTGDAFEADDAERRETAEMILAALAPSPSAVAERAEVLLALAREDRDRAEKSAAFWRELATPPALPVPTASVEGVAAIIDPYAFKSWQNSYDYEMRQTGDSEEAVKFADWSAGKRVAEAKEKAAAIIASLTPAPTPEAAGEAVRAMVENLALPVVATLFVARGGATARAAHGIENGEDEHSDLVRLSDVATALEPIRAALATPSPAGDVRGSEKGMGLASARFGAGSTRPPCSARS